MMFGIQTVGYDDEYGFVAMSDQGNVIVGTVLRRFGADGSV